MSPAAQSVFSFCASASPPLVTCPQHASPESLDSGSPPVLSHGSHHMPGPAGPRSLARSIPLFPLTRSAAGACESGEVQGGFSAGLSGDPDQCQAERLTGHAQHSPMSFFVLAPLFPLPRTPALPFPNPCQNPVHLFQVFAPMPASSPQSPR